MGDVDRELLSDRVKARGWDGFLLTSHDLDALVDALIDPTAPLDRGDVAGVWERCGRKPIDDGEARELNVRSRPERPEALA